MDKDHPHGKARELLRLVREAVEAGDPVVMSQWKRAQDLMLRYRFAAVITACAALGIGPTVLWQTFTDRGCRTEEVEGAVEALEAAAEEVASSSIRMVTERNVRIDALEERLDELEELLERLEMHQPEDTGP